MANWLTTREALQRATQAWDPAQVAIIDRMIASASDYIHHPQSGITGRFFIPRTAARTYRWPQAGIHKLDVLHLDQDLLAVTSLTREGDDAVAIAAADYFLEPNNLGPPYSRIEIDLGSSAYFAAKDTPQRAVRVTGRWGFSEITVAASQVDGALTAAQTTLKVDDGSKVEVGHALLIGTEQVFVAERTSSDLNVNTSGAFGAALDTVRLTLSGAPTPALQQGEWIRVDQEDLLISLVVSTTVVDVRRAFNGTVLAAHSDAADVFVYRNYTIERGGNGTTAATQADNAAITRYLVPGDVEAWCRARAIHDLQQERSGWGRSIGQGEQAQEFIGRGFHDFEQRMVRKYQRTVVI